MKATGQWMAGVAALWLLTAAGVAATPARWLEFIPAGSFAMGDASPGNPAEGLTDEAPVHSVAVSAFFIENLPVTEGLWQTVRAWAATNGYADLPAVKSSPDNPMSGITWYDAVKWCNARSEQGGLRPVYFTAPDLARVYRTGTVNVAAAAGVFTNSGYRLPTEAEWEYAARGALDNQIYPWPAAGGTYADHIATNQAAYGLAVLQPAGVYDRNAWLLYDMAGNAAQWCWDWYDGAYYSAYATNGWPADPAGPAVDPAGGFRVTRGGGFWNRPYDLRVSFRDPLRPDAAADGVGLRCVLSYAANAGLDQDGNGAADAWELQNFGVAPHPGAFLAQSDRNGNGVPDWWEARHFGGATLGAADTDGDGMDNLSEYLDGTDWQDRGSVFTVQTELQDNNVVLSWSNAADHIYRIYGSTNLISGAWILQASYTNLPAGREFFTNLPPPGVTIYYRASGTTTNW